MITYIGFVIILTGVCGAILISCCGKNKLPKGLCVCDECGKISTPAYWYGTGKDKKPLCINCAERILD